MRGRLRGEPYAAGCPERWELRVVDDPHPGLIVVAAVEAILRDLDGAMQSQILGFAVHRYVDRKPVSAYPDGAKIDRLLLAAIGESMYDMDPEEYAKALVQVRTEGIRRRREYLAAWIAERRSPRSLAEVAA